MTELPLNEQGSKEQDWFSGDLSGGGFPKIDLPKAYSTLNLSAYFRSAPEDFIVKEELGFDPSDNTSNSGEHYLLHIEKIGQNTHWVAEQLAAYCDLPFSAVGYCGRKDRHAITRQWFSLYTPKQTEVDWRQCETEGVTILAVHRHAKKLRLGSHKANHFSLCLRNVTRQGEPLTEELKQQLSADIQERLSHGVPNYFGEQRFGRGQSNLIAAREWFSQKRKPHPKRRSMVMSAARSFLFNLVLAERVKQGNWREVLLGDVIEDDFPTGPLWGRGRSSVTELSQLLEEGVLTSLNDWRYGLEYCGLKQERRSLVLRPNNINIRWLDTSEHEESQESLQLSFSLEVGAFATSVLAEVTDLLSVSDKD